MRLIDADALDAEMYRKSFEVDDGRNVWNSGLWIRYKIYEEAIRDAPTVDAVPVVHGRWWHDEGADLNELTCSVCNKTYRMRMDLRANVYPHNYCPNCGAKMDWAERGENETR